MNFEILKSIPISGELDEIHFGKADSKSLWVKFYSNDFEQWYDLFAGGDIGLVNRKVIEVENNSKIGLLTNGAFYLIDLNLRALILNPFEGGFTDFEFIPNTDLIILTANCGIYIFSRKKQIKEIKPDFINGIRFLERYDDILIGEICEPAENGDDWSNFELDTQTLKLKWGKYEY